MVKEIEDDYRAIIENAANAQLLLSHDENVFSQQQYQRDMDTLLFKLQETLGKQSAVSDTILSKEDGQSEGFKFFTEINDRVQQIFPELEQQRAIYQQIALAGGQQQDVVGSSEMERVIDLEEQFELDEDNILDPAVE